MGLLKSMKYESIIGLSGGLDSSTTACLLKELGKRPLAFVFDNNWNTEIANRNIQKVLDYTKFDCLFIKVDWEQFRDLQLAFIKSGISNIEIPTDHLLYALIYKIANMVGAKIIYNGGNSQSEGYMPEEWSYNARDLKMIKAIHRRFGTRPMDKLPVLSLWGYIWNKFIKGIKVIQPLEEYDYKIKEAKEELKRLIDFEEYGEKHEESIYTRWFQQYYLPIKFGVDKRVAHFQSLVNSGQMTKEEMEEKLKIKYPDEMDFDFNKLGITWEKIMKIPKKTYKDYPNNSKLWKFLEKIWITLK